MKNKIYRAIDARREDIIRIAEQVMKNPELGYKEYKTSELVKQELGKLGVSCRSGLALTGVKGTVGKADAEINVAVIGELDAIRCFGHPDADPETGAAHACGHHAQIAILLGAAYGILESGVLDELDGKVTFFAVPAEEFAELEYREQLKRDGKISYFGGKQELISLGEFDDIDISMMLHSLSDSPEPTILLGGSSLGFTAKQISFKGKAVHGSEPFEGVNALNAAMLALMGIHANRETFRDSDKVRIHPIITNGGELVNVVPAKTTIETYVRGARAEAIEDACRKVDAAVRGGAMAVGAECEIVDTVGYLPLHQDKELTEIFAENAKELVGEEHLRYGIDMIGSTDMGDLSAKMPCIHPSMGGYVGSAHGIDFATVDPDAAYILPAKLLAATVCDLLRDGAARAKSIKANFNAKK